jgi:hypothetical protein
MYTGDAALLVPRAGQVATLFCQSKFQRRDMQPIQTSFDGHLAGEEPTCRKLLLPRFAEPGARAGKVAIQNNSFKRS